MLLGRISVSRDILPVCDTTDQESPCTREHRTEILDAIRAAYGAGRDWKATQTQPGHLEGDPEEIWNSRIRACLGSDPLSRALTLNDKITKVVAGRVPVVRQLKGEPGWKIGGAFVSLVDLLSTMHDRDAILHVEKIATREVALAAGRAL